MKAPAFPFDPRRLSALALLLALIFLLPPARANQELTLGMFAYRPKALLESRWQPLAHYLTRALPGHTVRLRVLNQEEIGPALARQELDFLFTNPNHFIALREMNTFSGALATLVGLEGDIPADRLGGVFVRLKERKDLKRLEDIAGKRVAAAGINYLGGYLAQSAELHQAGIDPRSLRISFTGQPHDRVLEAVLSGRADVGFVRTGVIEQLVREGKLDPARIEIINRRYPSGFPFIVSTRLYPEWPLVALPQVDAQVARRVAAALLALEPDHPVSRAAGISGFTIPADYSSVEQAMRDLRLYPFDTPPRFNMEDVWSRYWGTALLALLAGVAVIALVTRLLAGNHHLAQARREALHLAEGLARERLHLQTLIRTLPDLVWLKDPEGVYLSCNPRFERFFGAREADIVGKTDYDFVDRESADSFRAHDRKAMERGGPSVNEEWVTFAGDGHRELVETTKTPMLDNQGRLIGVLGIAHDITERTRIEKELRRESEKNLAFLRNASDGIHILDIQGNLLEASDSFCAMLGYGREELIGKNVSLWDAGFSPAEVPRVVGRQFERQVRSQFETRHRRKDGAIIEVEVSCFPFELDGERVLFNSSRDITETRRIQRELQRRDHYQRALLDNFPFLVWLKDAESRFLAVNQPFAYACGLASPEAFVGKTDLDVWPRDLAEAYQADDRAVLASGMAKTVEEMVENEGRRAWFETYKSPVSVDGRFIGTVGFSRDITERRNTERMLEIQHQFAGILANSPGRGELMRAILDSALSLPGLDGGGLYWRQDDGSYRLILDRGLSDTFTRQVELIPAGSQRAELIGRGRLQCSCREINGNCTIPELVAAPELRHEGILSLVVLPILANGDPVACLNLASKSQANTSGQTLAALETLTHQFTRALERLQTQEEAERQRLNLSNLFNTMQDYLFVVDMGGRIIHFNRAVEIGLGYDSRLLGRPVTDVHPAEARDEARRIISEMLAGATTHCPLPLLKADGGLVSADTLAIQGNWNGQPAIFGISRDITELIHTTEALRASEENLRRAQSVAKTGSWSLDIPGKRLTWSEETYRIFGLPVGRPMDLDEFVAHVHADDLESVRMAWDAALGGAPYDIEHRIVANGQVKWVRERAELSFAPDGTALSAVGTAQDISERKRADQALREAGQFLSETQSIARLGGWKANPAENRILWTEEVYRLVEHPLDQPPADLEEALRYYAPECLPAVKRSLTEAWEHGTPFTMETEMISRSGRRFWAELRCIGRVENDEGEFITGTFHDIGERKRAEEMQRFSAFQSGVAEMSVSVLHNIGNAITSVVSDTNAVSRTSEELARVAGLLETSCDEFAPLVGPDGLDEKRATHLLAVQRQAAVTIERLYQQGLAQRSRRINDSVQHIADIVRIQQNAAIPSASSSSFDLSQALRDALAMHGDTLLQHGIRADLRVDPAIGQVVLSRNRLLQAMLNVVKNAYEAIRERQGEMDLDAGFKGLIRVSAEALDEELFRIRVMDNGIGIARDQQPGLFRFGYSTKARGSGFGLHATALFAQDMGGDISIDSDGPGRGATLTMTLPRSILNSGAMDMALADAGSKT